MLTTEYILLINQSNFIKTHRTFQTVPMARKPSRFQDHKLNSSGEDILTAVLGYFSIENYCYEDRMNMSGLPSHHPESSI